MSTIDYKNELKHLFILSGQSNMVGLDPKISFIPVIEEEFGPSNIIVVKDAQNGQPIRRWYKKWKSLEDDTPKTSGDLYDRLMVKVNAATTAQKIKTVTFVWMQGERDAYEKHGAVYARSLSGLLTQLSDDLARKDINFVIGRISDFDMNNEKYVHWRLVRKAQVEFAETTPHAAWIDTDDINGPENALHYTKEGYKVMGERFARKSIELIHLNDQQNSE